MPRDTEIHKAAYKGDQNEIIDYLDRGGDVNILGAQDRTALHRAVGGKSTATTKLLIDRGATIAPVDNAGRTPMHWAGRLRVKKTYSLRRANPKPSPPPPPRSHRRFKGLRRDPLRAWARD